MLAGGAGTGLLRRLGIAVDAKDYRRAALVTVVALDRAHRGTAWERFAPEGPLALLPLPDSPAGEPRAAVVWTLEPARAEALAAAPEESFLAALGQAFGHRAGRFRSLLAPRGRWPLGLQLAREQVRSRLAVVGNAAHALHPVAGQGFNLALRNAARLAAAVAESEDPGDLGCLEGYLDEALPDQRRVLALSDSLPSLFALTGAAPTLLRGFALAALDLAPPLRRGFARLGSGLPGPVVPLAP
ncbi:MAG: hypothetical protein KatS3mg124_1906 [Porticoccaceae bacterium]|nr:MAG: hypothetical protein KatS3mg124_1906 [Porticoccaceae bacterium]